MFSRYPFNYSLLILFYIGFKTNITLQFNHQQEYLLCGLRIYEGKMLDTRNIVLEKRKTRHIRKRNETVLLILDCMYLGMQCVFVPSVAASRSLRLIPSFPFLVLLILISKCRSLPAEKKEDCKISLKQKSRKQAKG